MELAKLVIEMTGSKSQLVYKPLPADDPTKRKPDISLAKKHLHWEPQIPLEEGLRRTIAWFRSIDLADYRPPTPNH
jgi:UDP-glucuronate decarboxylase